MQPPAARDTPGVLHIEPEFAAGVRDLDGFSHVIVLYHLHLVRGHELTVVPFLDDTAHGIFATRAPKRPNPIGMSIYRLARIDGPRIHVLDVDAVDGSPILDIKPYVPAFDAPQTDRIGWFEGKLDNMQTARADTRFDKPAPRVSP